MRISYDGYQEDRQRIMERIPRGWFRSLDIGDGWMPIVIELDRKLAEIDPEYEIHQVKEKFGGLRFYWAGDASEMFKTGKLKDDGYPEWGYTPAGEAVRDAEQEALKTCEFCGEPGILRNDLRWLKTLCDTHYEERRV